jgi:hypothetical protein
VTSYQLAVQDSFAFKRKRWYYLILDEAHNIKNFQSQRWQTLINFNSQRRLLLTGTPLQVRHVHYGMMSPPRYIDVPFYVNCICILSCFLRTTLWNCGHYYTFLCPTYFEIERSSPTGFQTQ